MNRSCVGHKYYDLVYSDPLGSAIMFPNIPTLSLVLTWK